MNFMTTVILFTPPELGGAGNGTSPTVAAMPQWSNLSSTLNVLASTGMHVVLAANDPAIQHALRHTAAVNTTVLSDTCGRRSIAESVASAVLASSQADGWLILPAGLPMLRAQTLHCIAQAIQAHPIAYPQYKARKGHPIGVSRELFSELVHLENDRDLERLSSRYPAIGVDVDDPGVVMHEHALHATALGIDEPDLRGTATRGGWHLMR